MNIEYEGDKLEELVRLTRENNRMLHAMRRSAWIGGIFKIVLYGALILVPLWLYMQYVAPMMQTTLEMYKQMQGTSAQAQAQFSGFQEAMQKFQSFYGGGQ